MTDRTRRTLGAAEAVAIGQGTWQMEDDDRVEAVRALCRGVELGMTHVDTAEMYGGGEVERLVGEALRALGAAGRDRVLLTSKVLPSNASFQGVLDACERSLRALGTDRLELYLLHWPGQHPLEQTFRAFERLRDDGKIRAFGVSNFDVADLEQAHALVGAGAIACNQVLYHLQERAIEHAVLPWCEAHGVAVVGYSPFGSGHFPDARSEGGRVLADIAEQQGASPHQVALSFLVRRPSLLTIPKAARVAHVEDNAGAASLVLSPEDIARIDAAFPAGAATGLPVL